MYKKKARAVFAGLMAAAVTVSAAVNPAMPLTVSAGEVLGESGFEYKIIPWRLVEASPAKQTFSIEDGALHVRILVPKGADQERWDLQLRHRGLNFRKGHVYKVSFKAKAARNGMELCSAFSNLPFTEEYFELDGKENNMHMGPDMGGMWPSKPVELTTEWQKFEGTFIPTENLEGVQWTLQYAKGSNYAGNAVEGDEIWFDDMSIQCTTCEDCNGVQDAPYGMVSRSYSNLQNNYISVNQLGYYPQLAKNATLGDNQGDCTYGAASIVLEGSYDYEIVNNETGEIAYTGKTGEAKLDKDSLDKVCKIDFTAFSEPGEYYIRIKGKEWRSFPFKIGTDIYQESGHDMLTNALNYFYQNRSGINYEEKYITSGDKKALAYSGMYKAEKANVQKIWKNEYLSQDEASIQYASSEIDASGGWFSASDYGKYMTEGGMSVWTLQNMYERASRTEKGKEKFADNSGTVVIPENGNDIPDILDECRYELDFMSKMKVQPDEPTWGEYAGLYYHKVQDHVWVELATRPWDYIGEKWETVRIVKPPTFAATLNYAACAAQAARLWKPYDAEYAAELLKNAKDAYDAFTKYWYQASITEENNDVSLYAPKNQGRTGQPYGDDEVLDDAYWAACELYISASEMKDADAEKYLKALSEYQNPFTVTLRTTGSENSATEMSYTAFNWENTASAGSLSLALHPEVLSDEQNKKLNESIIVTAKDYIYTESQQGYGVPYKYDGADYIDLSGLPDIRINGYEYGSNAMAVYNMIVMAYAYDLTHDAHFINGITTGMDYLLGNNPLAFSYVTGYGSYHEMNPHHRYWTKELDTFFPSAPDGVLSGGPNAGVQDVYMRSLGFVPGETNPPSQRMFADSVEAWSVNSTELQWNAPFAWIVSFLQDEAPTASVGDEPSADKIIWGDNNCDGTADIADAVMLAKYLSEDPTVKLTEQGKQNANIIKGELDSDDITALLMSIAKLIKSEQFPLDSLPSAKTEK